MSVPEATDHIDRVLDEPLPDEVPPREMERLRRRRIAEQNANAVRALGGLT